MFVAYLAFVLVLVLANEVSAYESNFSLSLSERYVDFCGAAYCTDPILKKNSVDDWSCQVCKKYPHVQAVSVHGSRSDANGFVAYDADKNEIIVSFSGTDPLSIQNWIDDIDFIKTSYPYCAGCEVHEGFWNAYKSIDSQVKSAVDKFISSYPSASLTVTGHSLGAAMAAHCMAELVHYGYKVNTAYTYGMPRVGNEEFEKWYTTVVPGTYRCVHKKDPVPHLAPENWGFHHMPYEIFYVEKHTEWKLCSFEGEDKSCSDQYLADLNVPNHLHYMGMDFTTNYLSCEL